MYPQKALVHVFLSIFDALFAVFVVAPLVIFFWRHWWIQLSIHVYSPIHPEQVFFCFLTGGVGITLFNVFQKWFASTLSPKRGAILFVVASRIYTFTFSVLGIAMWSSCNDLIKMYLGYLEDSFEGILMMIFPVIVVLVATRTLRNLVILDVTLDSAEGYFRVPTRFKLSVSSLNRLLSQTDFSLINIFMPRG